jgi:hypothetical protein
MRYDVISNLSAGQITYADMGMILATKSGAIGEDNILMVFEAIRLREIHLWGPAVTNTINNTIAIEFVPFLPLNNTTNNNESYVGGVNTLRTNDSSTSNTGSSHIVKYPTGLAAEWINPVSVFDSATQNPTSAGDQVMFSITAPTHSVLDLVFEVVMSDGSFPVLYESAAVTALGPGTYALGLGFTTAPQIVPQDYNVYD